nr:unnamed protein product [Callosobruchus analis]
MSKHPESGCAVKRKRQQLQCIHCNKTFQGKKALDDHIIRKHEEFIHQCDYCSYKTTNRSNYVHHMARHLGGERNVKQFPCVHCDSMFKSKRALDGHVFKNHKEFITSVTNKIHECQRCSYTTINRDNLATHRLKYHDAVKVVQKDL